MPSSRNPDGEVAKLALLIESHLTHIGQQLGPEVEVEPGSMGEAEQANAESGPAGPWGDIPPHTALSLAKLKLTVAGDHIGSLHKLLQPPLPLFGLMVMARASLEASSKAFWLLDPNISVRDRVARELGDRLQSAQEERKVLRIFLDDWVDPGAVEAIEQEARDLAIDIVWPPLKTTLAGVVLAEHMDDPQRGEGLYRYMCAVAHNANYALLQHFKEMEPAKDSRSQIVKGHMGLEGVWGAVAATLAGHTSAVGRFLRYVGADLWAWDRWELKIARDMNEVSRSFAAGMSLQP